MTDHEKRIREALEAGPTEGEWRDCGGYTPEFGALYSNAGYIVYRYADATVDTEHGKPIKAPSNEQQFANRKYIAACNPSAIRALLADLDAMREALGEAEEWVQDYVTQMRSYVIRDSAAKSLTRIRNALKGAEA